MPSMADVKKPTAAEKRAGYVAACFMRFIAARRQYDKEEKEKREEVFQQWQAKQRKAAAAAAKKKRKSTRRPKDPRKALTKALAALAKKSAKSLTAVWKALLDDIDEQVSKAKRFTCDDLPRGMQRLPASEGTQMRAWVASEGHAPRTLPAKGMNDNVAVLWKTILYAAPASAPSTAATVSVERAPLKSLRDGGLLCVDAAALGYSARNLCSAGYPAACVVASVPDPRALRSGPLSLLEIRDAAPGEGAAGQVGPPLVQALLDAGFSLQSVREAGVVSAHDLRAARVALPALLEAGYPPEALRAAGYGSRDQQPTDPLRTELKHLHASPVRTLEAGGRRGCVGLGRGIEALAPSE